MQADIWVGVAAMFAGLALTASIATLTYTQNLLKRSFEILSYCADILERDKKEEEEVKHVELSD